MGNESFKLGEPTAREIEKAMLDRVIMFAANDEGKIRSGIISVLTGVNDKARRTYLWNKLDREARNKIRQEKKKFSTKQTRE